MGSATGRRTRWQRIDSHSDSVEPGGGHARSDRAYVGEEADGARAVGRWREDETLRVLGRRARQQDDTLLPVGHAVYRDAAVVDGEPGPLGDVRLELGRRKQPLQHRRDLFARRAREA